MASESHPLACQLINVRGRDLLLSVTAEVSPSKIISQDEDNIDGLRVDGLRVLVRDLAKRHSLANDNADHGRSNGPKMGVLFSILHSTIPQKNFNSFSTSISNRTSVHEKFCLIVSSGVYLILIIRLDLFWVRFQFRI